MLRAVARCTGVVAIGLFVLTGCSTTYHAENANGGYGETRIADNVFRVTFKGNLRLDQSQTDEMALLRSAEVALDHGFGYFISSGNAPTGTAVSIATNVVSVPATTITIVCSVIRPVTAGPVYDAQDIVDRLGPRYRKRKPDADGRR